MRFEKPSAILNRSEESVLMTLAAESKVSLGEVWEEFEDAKMLVHLGYARLAAVAYPWGLEFELEITGSGLALVQRPVEVLAAQTAKSRTGP